MTQPTRDELVSFAQWAEKLQPNAIALMRDHGIAFTDLDEPWQELAFTFYCNLCEINNRVKHLFEDDEQQPRQEEIL